MSQRYRAALVASAAALPLLAVTLALMHSAGTPITPLLLAISVAIWLAIVVLLFVPEMLRGRRAEDDWVQLLEGLYVPPFPAGPPRDFQAAVADETGEFDKTAAAYPEHHVSVTLEGTRNLVESLARGALESWSRHHPPAGANSLFDLLAAMDARLLAARESEARSVTKAETLIGSAGAVLGRSLVESAGGAWLYRWGSKSKQVGYWATSVEIPGASGKVEINPFLEARRRLSGERTVSLADASGHRTAPAP